MNVFRNNGREPLMRPRREGRLHGLPKPPPSFLTPQLVPKAQNIHASLVHMHDEQKKVRKRLAEVEKENASLRGENAGLKKQYRDVYLDNDKLRRTVVKLQEMCLRDDANIHELVHHIIPSLAPSQFPDFAKINGKFVENQENIGYYDNEGSLGKGHYGEVSLGIHPDTNKSYAIKVIKKNRIRSYKRLQCCQEEVNMLRKLRHPNVIGLEECVNTPENLYIVTEFGGRDLHQWHQANFQNKNMQPELLREIFYGMCKGVAYVHEEGVCHLDLKPENVLIKSMVGKAYHVTHKDVRLCDFGFSTNVDEPVMSFCGTRGFFALEMVTVREAFDGRAADMWSLGCILLELSNAAPGWIPLYKDGPAADPEVFSLAMTEAVKAIHETKVFGGCDEVGDLFKLMLQMDPKDRVTAKDLLKHPWLDPLAQADQQGEEEFTSPSKASCASESRLEVAEKSFHREPLRTY